VSPILGASDLLPRRLFALSLRRERSLRYTRGLMFSHVVIFWTKPEIPGAADALVRPVPGVRLFHVGKMVKSDREVVEQSYQVALNLTFDTKKDQDDYQVHPSHIEFVEKVFKPNCARVVVYDFK
jgi:hypothetical protein